jgi:ribosomal protein S18 acetylase RimI-like enzyme
LSLSLIVEITRLQSTDWQLLRDLRIRAATTSPNDLGETLEELLNRTNDEYWVQQAGRLAEYSETEAIFIVAVDKAPGGLIYCCVSPSIGRSNVAVMWLDPKLRGRGIGRQLLTTAIDWAKAQGATSVSLFVAEGNMHAIRFYEKVGFVRLGSEPKVLRQTGKHRFWQMERQLV